MPELRVLDFPAKPQKKEKEKKRRKYEQADGTFKAKPMINGKRHTVRGKSTKEVEEKIEKLKLLYAGGMKTGQKNMTVEEWADTWIDAQMTGKAYKTRQNAQTHINYIKSKIGYLKLRDVREIHLQKMINSRAGMSKDHIGKTLGFTKRLFSSARKNGLILVDPAQDLDKPKGTYKGHRALEPWEMDLLLRNYSCHPAGVWAVLMMLSGVRVGEMLALKESSFDFEAGKIDVSETIHFESGKAVSSGTTKTDAGVRQTPLPPILSDIIRADFEQRPRKRFAVSADGRAITESSYRRQWQSLMHRLTLINSGYAPETQMPKKKEKKEAFTASLKPVSFTAHDLRYTYATMLFDAGVDEKTAQRWLGHTSPQMTRDLYAQLTKEREAKSDKNYTEYLKRFDPTRPQN